VPNGRETVQKQIEKDIEGDHFGLIHNSVCLYEDGKAQENISQDSRRPCKFLNRVSSEYRINHDVFYRTSVTCFNNKKPLILPIVYIIYGFHIIPKINSNLAP
jgi:hypothetical protein